MKLSMSNVAVADDGIAYVQYFPKKTMKTQNDRREKKTPLMLFALEIVKRSGFKFSVLKYASGKSGYNAKIKKILEHCKIDRLINQYDEATGTMNRVPLHSVGSSAVEHYSMLEISDLFMLLCASFNQPRYPVDRQLNVLTDAVSSVS